MNLIQCSLYKFPSEVGAPHIWEITSRNGKMPRSQLMILSFIKEKKASVRK